MYRGAACQFPDLSLLDKAVATGTSAEQVNCYPNITVLFEDGHELILVDAVLEGFGIRARNTR